ncbi:MULTISPECIES: hypothetical protein [unclassified Pseudomonas]|uniref:hypothetical protein n=1 Tax=unclassified Pseudomonas TaxID=196821 RepID=UPI0024494953|nr:MULTISPECIES: hypothetical protein [unclassified Pseudomonas]MDH0302807.1 hypothetical protein [Pseudomonas sp. GD04091]MDH1984380.1 hypothetical protein [Pseudomonas sp. GD03689]
MNAPVNFALAKKRFGGRVLALPQLNVPVRDATRGIIPVKDLQADVEIKVPKSPDLRLGDFIRLYRDGDFFGTELELADPEFSDPLVTEFTLYYEVSDFPVNGADETVALDYGIYDPISEDGQPSGLPVNVRFDRRPAGGDELPPIAFTDDQLSGITESDLVNDELPLAINPYLHGEAEDIIELWIGTAEDEASGTWLPTRFNVTNPRQPTPALLTRAELLALGDGRRYFAYRVTDWAGNVARISARVGIDVFLQLPALLAPLVPEADDGLVTYNDANPDVGVEIPDYPGAAVGDIIRLTWGATTLPPYPLTAADVGNDPLTTLAVPFSVVQPEGDGTIVVSYRMERAGQPNTPSPTTTVEVNLSTPGGPNPDPDPDSPEHGNIRAPLIRCGSSPDNTILPPDYGSDAVAIISRPGVDNQPIWLIDDVIQLHWQSISDPELSPVTVTLVNEPANISIPIPFTEVIDVTGSGVFDVWFTVTRQLPATPNPVPVTVRSPTQAVTVTAAGALPGDGNPLAQGDFPEANASNIITRARGIDGTTFRIPLSGVSNIQISQNPRVSYDFVGIIAPNQNQPSPPFTTIEDSRLKMDDVALTQQHLDAGYFEVDLPYALTYFICRNGAILDYSLANDIGRTHAIQRYVYFAMNQGGGGCSLP